MPPLTPNLDWFISGAYLRIISSNISIIEYAVQHLLQSGSQSIPLMNEVDHFAEHYKGEITLDRQTRAVGDTISRKAI